ncbi:MAG: ATP-binding protein [Candidatus Accumulibacter sp.]|uniref:ATP-binding protein n=1 Tax=Candidatus Accumulibacter proximus TaxID=2954385 RepID=A0A935Q158_9PROT|nr:ATP-binding protein [Candidatus Accumulibacter proximus]
MLSNAVAIGWRLTDQRHERKSLTLTANPPFSGWDQVFSDAAMTVAAVDRLVHLSTVLELNLRASGRHRSRAERPLHPPSLRPHDGDSAAR